MGKETVGECLKEMLRQAFSLVHPVSFHRAVVGFCLLSSPYSHYAPSSLAKQGCIGIYPAMLGMYNIQPSRDVLGCNLPCLGNEGGVSLGTAGVQLCGEREGVGEFCFFAGHWDRHRWQGELKGNFQECTLPSMSPVSLYGKVVQFRGDESTQVLLRQKGSSSQG